MRRLTWLLTLFLCASAQAQDPAKDFTGVRGRVTDSKSGEALIEASVKVITGASKTVLTDVDGLFELKLPPGTYDLRVFYELYEGRKISGVLVKAGQTTQLDVQLSSDSQAVQEVVVEARADRRNEQALLEDRKRSVTVSDAISAQEIARTPDSSASDAVKRVVSATIVDNKFVLLRGLGGRYSTTLLNGALLPSPEPDEPSVPLDLFPTSLLANLNVLKTYSPHLPGQFGGGALAIETNSYPNAFELKARLSLSGDSQSTFKVRPSQSTSFGESLGFAGAARKLPATFPKDGPVDGPPYTRAQRADFGRQLYNEWTPSRRTSLPNAGLSLSVGDTLAVGGMKLGYLGALTFSRRELRQRFRVADVQDPGTGLVTVNPASQTIGINSSQISALGNAGLQISAAHELSALSLFTRGAEVRSQFESGFNQSDDTDYDSSRLQFISRQLTFNQLRGTHKLSSVELQWQANYSRVDREEPDTRDLTYYVEGGERRFANRPNGKDRFFADLSENSVGASSSAAIPLSALKLEAGGLGQLSYRTFNARRFQFNALSGVPVNASAEELFAPENLGQSIDFEEATLNEDAYNAFLGIYAAHVSADWKLSDKLRVQGGARYELSSQTLSADSPFKVDSSKPKQADKTYRDLLPAANVVYALSERTNLRAGYSYTLARPTFRELAPFYFYDFVRRRGVSGNPSLEETRIHNGDLRAEFFPGATEVLAASVFVKRFEKPIERVIANISSLDLTYRNADGANMYGVELEARAGFGRFSERLRSLSGAANVTLSQSRIELGAQTGAQTSSSRALQGHSPYVLNLNLSWAPNEGRTTVSALYNVYGPRISEVGVQSLPDTVEQPFHRVDLSLAQELARGMQLKLSVTNLLNSSITLMQGEHPVQQYRPGLSFQAQLGWTL